MFGWNDDLMRYGGSGGQGSDLTYMLKFTKQSGFRTVLSREVEVFERVFGARFDRSDRLDRKECRTSHGRASNVEYSMEPIQSSALERTSV